MDEFMPTEKLDSTGVRELQVKQLGLRTYEPVWRAMQAFVDQRDEASIDEVWCVEHEPVYTQGQAGKPEHVLNPCEIPIVPTDRGGQVTYHGPGQAIIYPLLDMRRLKLGVRELVTAIEETVVGVLWHDFGIESAPKPDAPGVYVNGAKIASLGLRIRKGRSFHGVSINTSMNLEPFDRINPCGYQGLKMTQIAELIEVSPSVEHVQQSFVERLASRLDMSLV